MYDDLNIHLHPSYTGCMGRGGREPLRRGPGALTFVFGTEATLVFAPGPFVAATAPFPFHTLPRGVIPHVR